GLAAYDSAETPGLILSRYGKLSPEEKIEAINTLASRSSYAVALLEAVKEGRVARRDITPFSARQTQTYKDPTLQQHLALLGPVRDISGSKAEQIERYKRTLTPALVGQANPRSGRAIFQRVCASCHALFDDGGKLAPEL